MKRGYHFTSAQNWESIQVSGLVPYRQRAELAKMCDGRFAFGVLVWPEPPDLEGEIGCVLWQVQSKRCFDVVQLEVRYQSQDVKRAPEPDTLRLWHNGHYNDGRDYHRSVEFLIMRYISPERVSLVASYHVPQRVRDDETGAPRIAAGRS